MGDCSIYSEYSFTDFELGGFEKWVEKCRFEQFI
jgi:hypothetical protein